MEEKLKSIDKPFLQSIRKEITTALLDLSKKYGITLQAGNISFTQDTFTVKVEGKLSQEFIVPKDYSHFGYPALGTEFLSQGKKLRVVEHRPSSPKFPIIAQDDKTGSQYKFTPEAVTRLAGK